MFFIVLSNVQTLIFLFAYTIECISRYCLDSLSQTQGPKYRSPGKNRTAQSIKSLQ